MHYSVLGDLPERQVLSNLPWQFKKKIPQKQPPEVFCKKSFSYKFSKIPSKTPVPESLF